MASETYLDGPDGSREVRLFIFDTSVSITAYPPDDLGMPGAAAPDGTGDAAPGRPARLDEALSSAVARCEFFERTLSRTRADSDISRSHAASPDPVEVSPETAELVRIALGFCEGSRGCFDITMGTVTSLWDFHRKIVPAKIDVARALEHVGTDRIVLAGSSERPTLAITDPKSILDLGGVAKGYIADDLGRLLEGLGITRYVLDLGGNLLMHGGRPGNYSATHHVAPGDPWKVGIVNPRDPRHHRAILELAEGSVVTSGLHERCFTLGGKTYHHILDPRTGMPARTDVTSATIIAPHSVDCDGWSTTALMLGAREAVSFIEEKPGIEAVIIDERDEVMWTSGVADRLSLIPTLPRL